MKYYDKTKLIHFISRIFGTQQNQSKAFSFNDH